MGMKAPEKTIPSEKYVVRWQCVCQGGGSQKRLGEAEESTSGIFLKSYDAYDMIYNNI